MRDETQPQPEEIEKKTKVVESFFTDGINYLSRLTLCGKDCKGCPHGPYWFARMRRHGIEREVYIGKKFMTLSEFNLVQKQKRKAKKNAQSKRSVHQNGV